MFIYEARCLRSPNGVLKVRRILGELLVFSSDLGEALLQQWDRRAPQKEQRQAGQSFLLLGSVIGCYLKAPPTFRVGLFNSNTLIKGISHGSPDPVRLTTKISHHREEGLIQDYSLNRR